VPEAAAAGQLYVSAENAQFGNLFGGGQVVEVIVRDPNRADTEVAEAEPTVRVDNNILRMAQGVDGFWYAYIASDAELSGATGADTSDNNLDYGIDKALGDGAFVDADGLSAAHTAGETGRADMTTYSKSVFLAAQAGVISNPPTLSDYNGTNNSFNIPVDSNNDASSTVGQIGLNSTEWPFIQTFDFTQGEFDIILEQAGADEVVTLDYNSDDLDDYASLVLDRTAGTQGSQVHIQIIDQQLNIDPTNEDIVVFLVTAGSEGVSFTNNTQPNTGGAADAGFAYKAYSNQFSENGVLKINYNANGADTAALVNDDTLDDLLLNDYLVFYEGADNSGNFWNTDDADNSNLDVNSLAKRGTTATIEYNDVAQSYIVANDFGDIDMDESSIGVEWNSGETLAVTLTDQDLNQNTWSDEDMTLATHNTTIPAMIIGSPITLDSTSKLGDATMTVSAFNKIGTIRVADSTYLGRQVTLNYTATTVADFRAAHLQQTFCSSTMT
jgi:hypothetical protein